MNPIRLKRPAPTSRKVWCQRAMDCLDYAIEQGWPGFSCEQCMDYEAPADFDPRLEASRCADLLAVVINENEPRWSRDHKPHVRRKRKMKKGKPVKVVGG